MSIDYVTDTLAVRLFGRSREDAWTHGECVRCRRLVWESHLSAPDLAEYRITALCPRCFDAVTEDAEA